PLSLDVQKPVFQLLPESRCRPVLNSEAGPLGDAVVLTTKQANELVTELQRSRSPLLALAEVVKSQPQRLADGEQPLEVCGLESKHTSVDRAFGAHELRVALAVLRFLVDSSRRRSLAACSPVDYSQLVQQNFLGR